MISFIKNIYTTTCLHGLLALYTFLIIPIFVRVSSTEVYGSFVLFETSMTAFLMFGTLGIGVTAKRFLPGASLKIEKQELFNTQLMTAFLIASIAFLSASFIYYFNNFGSDESFKSQFVLISACCLFASFFFTQSTIYFRYTHRLITSSALSFSQPYMFLSFIIIMSSVTRSLLSFVDILILFTLSFAIAGIVGLAMVYKELDFSFKLPTSSWLRQEVKIGFPLSVSVVLEMALIASDRYLIAIYLGLEKVGSYAICYAVSAVILIVPRIVNLAFFPVAAALKDNCQDSAVREYLHAINSIFLLVAIPFVFGSYILGEDLLRLYASSEVAVMSEGALIVLVLSNTFMGLTSLLGMLLFLQLKTKHLLLINLSAVFLNVCLNIIALEFSQSTFLVACSSCASMFFSYLSMAYLTRKSSMFATANFRYVFGLLLSASIMCAFLSGVKSKFGDESWLAFITMVLAGIVVYALLIFTSKDMREKTLTFMSIIYQSEHKG